MLRQISKLVNILPTILRWQDWRVTDRMRSQRSAVMLLLHVALEIKNELEARLRSEQSLFLSDTRALGLLKSGSLRMSDLAEGLGLSAGGVTKVVGRLEEMGLLAREPDSADRRATRVSLTDSGRAALGTAASLIDDTLGGDKGELLSEGEAEQLVQLLTQIRLDRPSPH